MLNCIGLFWWVRVGEGISSFIVCFIGRIGLIVSSGYKQDKRKIFVFIKPDPEEVDCLSMRAKRVHCSRSIRDHRYDSDDLKISNLLYYSQG